MTTMISTMTTDAGNEEKIELGKQAKSCWKTWMGQGGKPNSAQMAIYAMLRGKSMAKTFSPIINVDKLANGQEKWGGRNQALNRALMFRHSDWIMFAPLLGQTQSKPIRWIPGEEQYIPQGNPILMNIEEMAKTARMEN